jgi:hypothetical protein
VGARCPPGRGAVQARPSARPCPTARRPCGAHRSDGIADRCPRASPPP